MNTILHKEPAGSKEKFIHSWYFSSDHDYDSHITVRCYINGELTEMAISDIITSSFEELPSTIKGNSDFEITCKEYLDSDDTDCFKFEFIGGTEKLAIISHSRLLEKNDFVFMMHSSQDQYQKYL